MSGAYLAGRYGIRPMVSEVQGIMNAIDSLRYKKPERQTSRGYQPDEGEANTTYSAVSMRQNLSGYQVTQETASVRAGVMYSADIRDTWGTNLSQVPIALWELTFLSFMADWFANIGDYISALTPKAGVNIHGSWVTTEKIKNSHRDWSFVSRSISDWHYVITVPCQGFDRLTTVEKSRSINPRRMLAYRPRGIKFDLGTARITDMIAIGRQLLKGPFYGLSHT